MNVKQLTEQLKYLKKKDITTKLSFFQNQF